MNWALNTAWHGLCWGVVWFAALTLVGIVRKAVRR